MLTVIDSELWDVETTAQFLKVSRWWIYRKVNSGALPCRRIGRGLKFLPSQIHAWVEKQPSGGMEQ